METGPESPKKGSCAAFRTIAKLAPQLRDRELRTLLALADLFGGTSGAGEIRFADLAAHAAISRSGIQIAVRSLASLGLIAMRPGRGHEPSHFALKLFRKGVFRVPNFGTLKTPSSTAAGGRPSMTVREMRSAGLQIPNHQFREEPIGAVAAQRRKAGIG